MVQTITILEAVNGWIVDIHPGRLEVTNTREEALDLAISALLQEKEKVHESDLRTA